MNPEINDNAINDEPETLNPHNEYLARLVERRRAYYAAHDAITELREHIRNNNN